MLYLLSRTLQTDRLTASVYRSDSALCFITFLIELDITVFLCDNAFMRDMFADLIGIVQTGCRIVWLQSDNELSGSALYKGDIWISLPKT